jgi:hypothetical protein
MSIVISELLKVIIGNMIGTALMSAIKNNFLV